MDEPLYSPKHMEKKTHEVTANVSYGSFVDLGQIFRAPSIGRVAVHSFFSSMHDLGPWGMAQH